MKKALGYLFSPLHYLSFGLFLVIFHPLQWLSLKLGGYLAHKHVVDTLDRFLVYTYYLLGCRVKFNNIYDLPQNRSLIFVANHQSMYDVPALGWFLHKYHAKFVSKIELTKGIPSISFNLLHGGGANIDRNNPKQAISELIKFAGRMKENTWSAIIFPEGTRSKDGHLKPFAIAGVSTLLKKVPGALIVPIVIKNSWKLTKYGKYPLSFGERISFTVLKPIESIPGEPDETVFLAEAAIKTALKSN